ncbi:hypothetical protein [Streptomyces fuscichromogenes]|uniref:hypothetical protein n=1 Tax=Streptomyces fuscichromogenes TaxID=1324013 RepID=UPI0016716DA9|nr:hypothetical protein [Streptomyces fuscichromogenes]
MTEDPQRSRRETCAGLPHVVPRPVAELAPLLGAHIPAPAVPADVAAVRSVHRTAPPPA